MFQAGCDAGENERRNLIGLRDEMVDVFYKNRMFVPSFILKFKVDEYHVPLEFCLSAITTETCVDLQQKRPS